MTNEYWDKEEFEDLVARGLIAMYESNIKKHKEVVNHARFTPKILDRIRRLGCYFSADDRVVAIDQRPDGCAKAIQELDIVNEGRPDFAVMTHRLTSTDEIHDPNSMRYNCYLENCYMERISELPTPLKCKHEGKKYRLVKTWVNNKGFLEGSCYYVVIDHTGKIYSTYWYRQTWDDNFHKCRTELVCPQTTQSADEMERAEDIIAVEAHATIQCWQDRRFLWNVTANEGIARATFGVYPEEVKSLFYARSMPMTETGRKRPMLHWVASHQRRIKSGIEIDIEKHLRGINEFVYNGTKFSITRPIKQMKTKI